MNTSSRSKQLLSLRPHILLIGPALSSVVKDIADVFCRRSKEGNQFGAVLIPEGLISTLPLFRNLAAELNDLITSVDPSNHEALIEELEQ